MKTPEEIKKGLEWCTAEINECDSCPYREYNWCEEKLKVDALELLGDLFKDREERDELAEECQYLEQRLAQAERERDAAVRIVHGLCLHCKNDGSEDREKCRECMYNPHRVLFCTKDKYNDNWEWRGVCGENSKEDIE